MTRQIDLTQPVAAEQQLFAITLFSGRRTTPRVLYVRAPTALDAEELLARLAPGATNVLIEQPTTIPPARVDLRNGVLFLSPLEARLTNDQLLVPLSRRPTSARPTVPAYRADPENFAMQMDVFARMRETEREFALIAKEVLP